MRTCSIAMRIALKSEMDMLQMRAQKRTKAENNSTFYYQNDFWYLTMITQTITMQFQYVMWIKRHSSFWIANSSIHCSLLTQLRKLAKSGSWHCPLQWQCTQSCVTYMMQEGYQWKEDKLLFTYMPYANFQIYCL